jgi:hypothetical protein
MLIFGLNAIVRLVMVRNHLAQTDVVATLTLRRRSREKIDWLRLIFLGLFVTAALAGFTQDKPFTLGVLIACILLIALWPLYVHGETRTTELLYFDSKGMTIFPARTGMLHQGAFRIRIDWRDTFGYTVYKGNILFSLLPSGYVEQHYGDQRLPFRQVLDGLGIRKLVAYDVIAQTEGIDLQALEQQVEATLHEVVMGYTHEFAMLGFSMEVDLIGQEASEDEDESDTGAFSIVRVKLLQEGSVAQEVEWLVWESYDDVIELISLPEDRLYETFDERLQAVLHQKMREAGIEPRQSLH